MGPFKHKVDDGLEVRKSAYECMYTFLDTCLPQIDIYAFLSRVLKALDDPASEIKILAHLMFQRLAYAAPTAVAQRLDDSVDMLKATVESKTKANAVKQELEKNAELVRSGLRCALGVGRLSEAGGLWDPAWCSRRIASSSETDFRLQLFHSHFSQVRRLLARTQSAQFPLCRRREDALCGDRRPRSSRWTRLWNHGKRRSQELKWTCCHGLVLKSVDDRNVVGQEGKAGKEGAFRLPGAATPMRRN